MAEVLVHHVAQPYANAGFENTADSPSAEVTSKNEISQYKEQSDQRIDQFLLDLDNPNDNTWEFCTMNERISVWRKMNEETGIYQIKFVAMLPYAIDVVEKVCFDANLRVNWDKVIDKIDLVEQFENGDSLLYFQIAGLFGIGCRDLLHYRARKVLEDKSRIIVDISVENDKVPERAGYIRAQTLVSAGKFQPTQILNKTTKKLEEGCVYSMISEVDVKGMIPKGIVNMFLAKTTLDWFESLLQACATKGEPEKRGWFW